jgi:hypothetical protein
VKRLILAAMLLSILASCRILCATSACSHPAEMGAPAGDGDQAPHPVNDDHCLCNGGLQADHSCQILSALDPELFSMPMIQPPDLLVGWLAVPPPRSLDGRIDLPSWRGSASRVRAGLGIYRC